MQLTFKPCALVVDLSGFEDKRNCQENLNLLSSFVAGSGTGLPTLELFSLRCRIDILRCWEPGKGKISHGEEVRKKSCGRISMNSSFFVPLIKSIERNYMLFPMSLKYLAPKS